MFANIMPRQTKKIIWSWGNKRTEHGLFAVDHPGVIDMPDLMSCYNWDEYEVFGLESNSELGTRNMKSIFTTASRFMGYEKLLIESPSLLPITEAFVAWNDRLLSAWDGRIKYFMIGDDYAFNGGLYINPEWWRAWVKPELAQLYQVAQIHNCEIIMHSDGDIWEILDDFIELGATWLNYQPVGMMRHLKGKKTFKGLKLWENEPLIYNSGIGGL